MKKILLIITIICLTLPSLSRAGIQLVGPPVKLIGGNEQRFMQPRWAPDGALIAFTSPDYHGLWVIQPDGSHLQQISDDPAAGFGFEWSADAKAIISRVAKYEQKFRYNAVKLFDLEKNEVRLITDYRTKMPGLPHWSAKDGKVCLFHQNKLKIYPAGRKSTTLQKSAKPAPVCFINNGQIAVTDGNSTNYKILETGAEAPCLNPVLSPDGTKIAFEIVGDDLYVINIDGSGLTDLGRGYRPQWAPDSKRLVYMLTEDDGHQYLAADLYTINIDGSEKTLLKLPVDKLEMNPSWSPDGTKILFDVPDEGAIYLIEITE